MNKIQFQFPVNLCAITSIFFTEASKRGLESWRSQRLWSVLEEILSQPQNLLAQKKFLLPVEKAEMAPEAIRNGFSVIPVQDDELRLMMEIMNLPTPPGGKKSVLISRGQSDFPELLGFLKNAGVLVNVIAIEEPMPAGLESFVENWINVSCSQEELEEPEKEVEASADLETVVKEALTEILTEEAKEAETEAETEEEVEEETEEEEEPLSTEEVLSLLKLGSGSAATNPVPKASPRKVRSHVTSAPKYEVQVQEKANRVVEKLNDAIEECALQKAHLENPNSAESPAKYTSIAAQTEFKTLDWMSQIYTQLKLAYDWFGRVLSENPLDPKLENNITRCANCALRLLGMYYRLIGDQADKIYNACYGYIYTDVITAHNQRLLDLNARKNNPWPLSELGSIKKCLADVQRIYADRIIERQVKGRLRANVQSLRRNPENQTEIFNCIMDDIRQLFSYFGYKPDDDFICDLFRPYLEYFPEDADFSDDFYRIRSEIEYKESTKEIAKYTPSELENRYLYNVDVQKVRKSFENKKLVVIGGIPKPEQKGNFEKAFGCEVEWRETSHGESLDFYLPYLSNPDVCAFMILIQLASHKHSQELGALARKAGTPFFRVHTTNPMAAAKEIVGQYIEE